MDRENTECNWYLVLSWFYGEQICLTGTFEQICYFTRTHFSHLRQFSQCVTVFFSLSNFLNMLSSATETSTNFVWTCIKVWRPLGLTDYNRCHIHAKWIQNFTHNKALSLFANGISYFRTLLKYVKKKAFYIGSHFNMEKCTLCIGLAFILIS